MEAQREYLTMATMTAEEATSRIIQLEVDQSITKTELLDALRELEQQKRNIGDNIQMAFASVKNRLDALINDTSRELSNLNDANKELLNRTANAVDTLDGRLRAVENWVRQVAPGSGYAGDRSEYRKKMLLTHQKYNSRNCIKRSHEMACMETICFGILRLYYSKLKILPPRNREKD